MASTAHAPRKKWLPAPPSASAGLTEGDMIKYITRAESYGSEINTKAINELYSEGIPHILTELFRVDFQMRDVRDQTAQDRARTSIEISVRFSDVHIGRPTIADYVTGKISPLYPNVARLSGRTYAAPLSLAVEVTLKAHYASGETASKVAKVPAFPVARIPVMVGSNRCHTWNLPREARKGLEEDPTENGGYFIAKGGEWVVEWLENISFNTLHIHRRYADRELARGEFISQPGGAFENSSQIRIRFMSDGAITIEVNNTKFSGTKIPFFVIFRLLGMTDDGAIAENIVYDPASSDPVIREMLDTVERAFFVVADDFEPIQHELDVAKITEFMAVRLAKYVENPTAYKSNEESVRYLNSKLHAFMDADFLPHLGTSAADRPAKLRYLGTLIHKILLVDMGILKPTDRDSYANKRVHGAGVSIAKAVKTQFNSAVVKPVKRMLRRAVSNTAFEEIRIANLVESVRKHIAATDLSRTLEQAITAGDSGKIIIGRRPLTNRVSSQLLERKNPVNVLSAQRGLAAHSSSSAAKQTQRATEMRMVHASYPGYVCLNKSADTGEKVGMKKELALSATVCPAGQPFTLVEHLREDPAVVPLDKVDTRDLVRRDLSCVYVNGSWVGCVRAPYDFVARYRALRREGRVVHHLTSVSWNPITGDVFFYLDVGRVTRPLLIVDSNGAEYDAARRAGKPVEFVQTIRLTPAHVEGLARGATTLEDLRREGVLEWVCADEAENCLVAPDIAALRATAHDPTRQWTHCDVPQALLGVTAHLSPYANHTQQARVCYETNQGRQAGSWYCLAAPFRADKGRFFQHYIEYPLVTTLTAAFALPCSLNTIIAYMLDDGYNQEDSGEIKLGYARGCGFAGDYTTKAEAVLDKGEEFGNPDVTRTKGLKPNASYEKLVDGAVPVGTRVVKGDVLIGRFAKTPPSTPGYDFVDHSVVYYHPEPAVVSAVYHTRDANDNAKTVVVLRYYRELRVGDKLSSRSGNKMINAILVQDANMPYSEDGITPDIIVNTHCLAGDTPVATGSGLARPIASFAAEGGETVWALAPGTRTAPAKSKGLLPKAEEQPVFDFYLEDGRSIRATDGHPILASAGAEPPQWIRAGELTPEHRVVCGLDLPLDVPRPDEAGWTLDLGGEIEALSLADPGERERSLAFARLLGLVISDGCISWDKRQGSWRSNIALGCRADCAAAVADIGTLTGRRPAVTEATPFVVALPRALARAMGELPGVPRNEVSRCVLRAPEWPAFLADAPVAVLREFLGGLFGGDGHAPCLVKNKAGAKTVESQTLNGVAISFTTIEAHVETMTSYMDELCGFLAKVGVPGCSLGPPVRRADSAVKAKNTEGQLRRVQLKVSCPPTPAFAAHVGFRYCAQKALRLSAANAYWRHLATIKRQHATVIADTIAGAVLPGVTRRLARDDAVESLRSSEPLVNEYYANPPMTLVNNRFRNERQKTLRRLDFARSGVLRPADFFAKSGCLDWFYVEGVTGDRHTYVAGREDTALPTFALGFIGKRARGAAPVYDLTVPGPTSFVAAGMVVHNSLPSRMTIGQVIEAPQSLLCQERGALVDGTSYREVDLDSVFAGLEKEGMRYWGVRRMFNGRTGEWYDAAIMVAPTASQRLLKFVDDDKYAAPGRGPTDSTTHQPLDGKNARGGLRVGEMEAWVLEAQGAMANLTEKMFVDSDGQKLQLCRRCGRPAIHNAARGISRCLRCRDNASVVEVDSCHAAIVAFAEIRASGIDVALLVKPLEFEVC